MSGEEVQVGDRVQLANKYQGVVESIVDSLVSTSDGVNYKENGPGVFFRFDVLGKLFHPADTVDNDEDLILVGRAKPIE